MGEKFAANPVTGTGNLSIPIHTSDGRSGFGPKLALSYDSGAGNGPFGIGVSFSPPSITRKTDKGWPRYLDDDESDVFLISGAEDLVPELGADGDFVEASREGYRVRRYRPRIEGLFAHIERWRNPQNPADTFWRSISRDNVTTLYGTTGNSRLFDPEDESRIFSWLIAESRDDRGNAIVYSYAEENSKDVDEARPHERNRTAESRTAQRYLKRIQYGNRLSRLATPPPPSDSWLFEVVFDYGESHWEALLTGPGERPRVRATSAATGTWPARPDPFSSHRAGFELRTYRRCQRVLMFHRFDELGEDPYLVRSTEFEYADLDYEKSPSIDAELAHRGSTHFASFLKKVTQVGYVRDEAAEAPPKEGPRYLTYFAKALPPIELGYSRAVIQDEVREVDADSLENLPLGLDGARYEWVDLDGEGLSGILTEQAGSWFFKRNDSLLLAATGTDGPIVDRRDQARFGPIERLPRLPSPANLQGGQQLVDLDGDGQLDVVEFGALPGYFERTADFDWKPFVPFTSLPNAAFHDPNLRFVDLTGDGRADLLVSEDGVFVWHESLGKDGFAAAERVYQALDEEQGPRVVFADASQSIYLADMSGDGSSDVVRIRNGEVCFWPNRGFGRFGPKVVMDGSPLFDRPELFNQRCIRLADVDGSGTTDILYLEPDGVALYLNYSGNGLSAPRRVRLPRVDDSTSVNVVDLLGNGTACLAWSSPLPGEAQHAMRYVDLMGGQKPHLLVSVKNNLGAETRITYAPSTKFYLADRRAGVPWITRTPFPVHCVERLEVTDRWQKTSFATTYSYHHAHYDGVEREFRGFGRVEQIEQFALATGEGSTLTTDERLYQPPVKTVTWYHTGAFLDRERILSQFEHEYAPARFPALTTATFRENALPEPDLVATPPLSVSEWREALRACKGTVLRQEVYELDAAALHARPDEMGQHRETKLFSTAYHNCHVERLQGQGKNRHAVFLVTESEAITYHYELDLTAEDATPDPRIAHTLNLTVDKYGNVLQSVAAVYQRFGRYTDATLPAGAEDLIAKVQRDEPHVTYTENRFTDDLEGVLDADNHRLPAPCEVISCELTGVTPQHLYFSIDELRALALSDTPSFPHGPTAVANLKYHELPSGGRQKRTIEHVRTLYFADDLTSPLALGTLNARALPYESYKLALTGELLTAVFSTKVTQGITDELQKRKRSGYLSGQDVVDRFGDTTGDEYWIPSGIAGFVSKTVDRFFLPDLYEDAFGNQTTLTYDNGYRMFVVSSTDAKQNTVSVDAFDFRVLAPARFKDINKNVSEVAFDALGMATVMAVKGKGTEADDLDGFEPDLPAGRALLDLTVEQLSAFFTEDYGVTGARRFLGNATTRYLYYFGEEREADGSFTWDHHPACAASIVRERHVAEPLLDPETLQPLDSPLQTSFEYSNGLGSVLVKKSQAEPAPGSPDGSPLRWIALGKTLLNNKGNPVKRYEPYFSNTHLFEEPTAVGVSTTLYYDAPGRLIRTDMPDGSYSRVVFSPWQVTSYDANDTVGEPNNAWYATNTAANATEQQKRAARLALTHTDTPSTTFLDALGRDVIAVTHNRAQYPGEATPSLDEKHVTFTKLDAEGKPLWIRDARRLRNPDGTPRPDHRGNLVMQYIRPSMPEGQATDVTAGFVPCYDIAGNLLFSHSMDAGDRFTLNDAAGKPMFAWDANERRDATGNATLEARFFETKYDELHRPIESWLSMDGRTAVLTERFRYGEDIVDPTHALNLRGQLHEHYDQSGKSTVVRCKFTGKPLEIHKTLAESYSDAVLDWKSAQLETTSYMQVTEYDALERMCRMFNWHATTSNRVAVFEPSYNERGLLASELLVVGAQKAATPTGYDATGATRSTVMDSIAYDAKGQRQAIRYGNGTRTRFTYDRETFRLIQLRTTRPGYDPDFPSSTGQFKNDQVVQNVFYTYDPVGNVTEIYDDAFEPTFFGANGAVEARSLYRYNALYRLIAATGREYIQADDAPEQFEAQPLSVKFPVGPTDPLRQRKYRQRYWYDEVGNILEVVHWAGQERWHRHYQYADFSNRLASTWLGTDKPNATLHNHDTHGNLLNFANVTEDFYLRWDHRDMLQVLNRGGGGNVYYQYDATKQRTRKVNDIGNDKQWERIYLGGMEIYRRYQGGVIVEETESHHVFDGDRRILLVEDVLPTSTTRPSGQLFRYQYSNHLGSACLELDDGAAVITYEEYHPYGTTAYRTAPSQTGAPKRYRFTGMERDEESGLSYHTARYYAPWLGRWMSCDPKGLRDGVNIYAYVSGRPTRALDRSGTEQVNMTPSALPPWLTKKIDEGSADPALAQRESLPLKNFDESKRASAAGVTKGELSVMKQKRGLSPETQASDAQAARPFVELANRQEILNNLPTDERMLFDFNELSGGNDIARAWTGSSEWNEPYSIEQRIFLGAKGGLTAYTWAAPAGKALSSLSLPVSSAAAMEKAVAAEAATPKLAPGFASGKPAEELAIHSVEEEMLGRDLLLQDTQFRNNNGIDAFFGSEAVETQVAYEVKFVSNLENENLVKLVPDILNVTKRYGIQATKEYVEAQGWRLIRSKVATESMRKAGVLAVTSEVEIKLALVDQYGHVAVIDGSWVEILLMK